MATVLLIFIFVIFIGLGVPDSAFGAALPAMWADLNLPFGLASCVSILTSVGTVTASFFSARLINKFGTGAVTALSTAITACALIGFSVTSSFWFACLCAVPLGLGAGAIDAALNNYVVLHYKSVFFNILHCFYGIGVALSPFVFSFALAKNNDWRLGYRLIFYIQIVLAAISIATLPLWRKVKNAEEIKEDEKPVTVSYRTMAKAPAVRAAWLVFFSTCALEFTCDSWGAAFLVGAGASESVAAQYLTLYYAGMTLGRFTSGLLSTKLSCKNILSIGYSLIAAALLILLLPLPVGVKGFAMLFIGLGNGPTFPNLTYATPRLFGKNISQSLVSSQMVASNLGILTLPSLFGVLAQNFSVSLFPWYATALFLAMTIATLVFFKLPKDVFLNEKPKTNLENLQ